MIRVILPLIILLTATACQAEPESQPLPTRFIPPTGIPTTPTLTPSIVRSPTPSATITPSPTITPTFFTQTPQPTMTPIVIPSLVPSPTVPSVNRPALPPAFIYGTSVQGRQLTARRFGDGEYLIMLVGGIHGGYESNTVSLINELVDYFEANPGTILPNIMLVLIPVANPDGVALGRTSQGRFNANGVDLNRNWGCDWQPTAVFQDQPVNPGGQSFSEPETQFLAALIYDLQPSVVLFYHAAANGIYGGDCDGDGTSNEMVRVLGNATGYNFGTAFSDYTVSGTAANWVDGLGIPAADVELATAENTDFARNLRGIIALQCWLLGDAAIGLEVCL